MFPKAIVSVDVKSIEVKHGVKPGEVNDDVKPGARPVIIKVDVRAVSSFLGKGEDNYQLVCYHLIQKMMTYR